MLILLVFRNWVAGLGNLCSILLSYGGLAKLRKFKPIQQLQAEVIYENRQKRVKFVAFL
jgi:hypothetical protein